jgi:hypothetical protein
MLGDLELVDIGRRHRFPDAHVGPEESMLAACFVSDLRIRKV